MPSLRVSHLEIVSSDGKDRSQRAAWRLLDAAFVFSSETSGRKCTLYRLPICYSIKQITGMQFKVVSSQSRLREFRAISHGSIHIHIYIHVYVYMRVYVYIHIHPFPISLFRKSPLIHLTRKRGCCATEIRRLRGFVRGEMQKISVRTKPRWKKKVYIPSYCPLLPRYSCEEIGDHFQITLVICSLHRWKRCKRITCLVENWMIL